MVVGRLPAIGIERLSDAQLAAALSAALEVHEDPPAA
jgi:hypothetical protein